MKKFPVTSENGNEYLAQVSYYDSMFYGEDVLNVDIFIKKGKSLFGKDKFVKVDNSVFEKDDSLNTDIISAVKKAVSNYEHKVSVRTKKEKLEKIRQDKILQSAKKFEEWDGVCK